MKISKACVLFGLGSIALAPLLAVQTAVWQAGTFDDFLQGTLQGVSLSTEGELRLAPETRSVLSPGDTLALSLAADRNHNLYVGTGHQGKVFRLDPEMKGSMFFTSQEPDIFALAVGPDGALYAGSSPEGKIYRITPDGKSKVFFDPKSKYIWALAFDAQGRLYAGSGDKGKIFRIDPSGKGEVFFNSTQTHIMCLTFDRQANLLAGSVPNGLVYRITPQGKAFVLYQAGLSEIHELATDAEGRVYAAAMGGPAGQGAPQLLMPQAPAVSVPGASVTTVTVVDQTSGSTSAPSPNEAQAPPMGAQPGQSFNRPGPTINLGFPIAPTPTGRGAIIEIQPDSAAETLWSSNNESVFGLAIRGHDILFSTDTNGRIFDLQPFPDGSKVTLVTETHESLATRLLLEGSELYVATSNIAKLIQLGGAPAKEGSYESPVKDTKFVSHWGVLAWRAEVPMETSLEFFSRSGNSERPDTTWSDWAGPYHDSRGSRLQSPPARYIQWKAVFHGSRGASPVLDDVTVSYLNQNLPPEIHSFTVSTGTGEPIKSKGTSSSPQSGFSVGNVTLSGAAISGFGPPQAPTGPPSKVPTVFNWQADDPNGDQLIYSIYVKATDEQEWHLLKDKISQTNYNLEPNALADGQYTARLVASDEESNPPGTARKSEMVSSPFWVDNTPPEVRVLDQSRSSEGVEVRFQAEDKTSPLRAAETSTDGKDWRDIKSDDGIIDSRVETFTLRLPHLAPGEHIITLRAYDSAGNVGIGKVVVRIPVGAQGPP